MITLEGSNIKILRVDYDKRCIEVVDLDSNVLFIGTYAFDVVREYEKPIKVVLYYYTAKPVDKQIEELVKENEQLKQKISELKCLLELAKLHTEVAEGKMDKFVELKLND